MQAPQDENYHRKIINITSILIALFSAVSFIIAVMAYNNSNKANELAKLTNEKANEANDIARVANNKSDEANKIAQNANKIAKDGNKIAKETINLTKDNYEKANSYKAVWTSASINSFCQEFASEIEIKILLIRNKQVMLRKQKKLNHNSHIVHIRKNT